MISGNTQYFTLPYFTLPNSYVNLLLNSPLSNSKLATARSHKRSNAVRNVRSFHVIGESLLPANVGCSTKNHYEGSLFLNSKPYRCSAFAFFRYLQLEKSNHQLKADRTSGGPALRPKLHYFDLWWTCSQQVIILRIFCNLFLKFLMCICCTICCKLV